MTGFQGSSVLPFGKLRYITSNHLFQGALQEGHPLVATRATLAHGGYLDKALEELARAGEKDIGESPFHFYNGLPSRERFEKVRAALKKSGVMEWAHERGIAVVSYNAGARFGGKAEDRSLFFEFYDKHWDQYTDYFGPKPSSDPVEWTRALSSGQTSVYTPQDTMVREFGCCINNPHMRTYVKGTLRIALELGIDGIFFDYSPQFCYCDRCVGKFRGHLAAHFAPRELSDIFGIQDASQADPVQFTRHRHARFENPLYVEWRRYRPQNYLEWLKEMRDYGRSVNPGFFISANACLWEGNPYRQFEFAVGPLDEWSRELDYLFIEGMFETSPHGNRKEKVANSSMLRYASAASRGRTVTFDCYMSWSAPPKVMTPLAELAVAECLANRSVFVHNWSPRQNLPRGKGGTYVITDLTRENKAVVEGLAVYNRFSAEHEDLFIDSQPYANVGVLCSLQQAYGRQKTSFMAVSRMLSDEQIPHVALIDDELIDDRLASFDAVILPEAPLTSDQQVAALLRFVEKGGGLIIIGETAAYDQYGRRRTEQYGFHALLEGMEPWGHIDPGIDPSVGVNATGKAVYGRGRVVHIPREAYIVFPDTGREKVVLFKDMASITTGAMISINAVFGQIVRWAANGTLACTCAADSTVELSLMQIPGKDRLVAHLVNYKVDLDGSIVEERDLPVTVTLPAGRKSSSATLFSPDLPGEKELAVTTAREHGRWKVSFTVPRLRIYDIVVVAHSPET